MYRIILFILIFVLSGCFNKEKTTVVPAPQGACGNFSSSTNQAPSVFKAQCAACHSLDKDLTGPKLKGILNRVPSEGWLSAFITNQDSLIQIKDKYTLQIMAWSPVKWNHNFSDIEKRDRDTLIEYITQ